MGSEKYPRLSVELPDAKDKWSLTPLPPSKNLNIVAEAAIALPSSSMIYLVLPWMGTPGRSMLRIACSVSHEVGRYISPAQFGIA